jgi:hypothetical protein
MSPLPSPSAALDRELERANALDALTSILPLEPREGLALLLPDGDVATLRHFAQEDLGKTPCRRSPPISPILRLGRSLPGFGLCPGRRRCPGAEVHCYHLWDPGLRERDRTHGMPDPVEQALKTQGVLRASGPHAPSTVKCQLAH